MPGRSVGLAPRKINLGTPTIARVFAEWVAVRSPAPHPSAKPSSFAIARGIPDTPCSLRIPTPPDGPTADPCLIPLLRTDLAPIKRARPTQAVTFSRQAAVTHLSDVPLERPEPLMSHTDP